MFRVWISRSWLMSLCRSISFVLRRHLYKRLCLHDAKNDAMWRAKCYPWVCIAFEKFSWRDFSKKCAETNCLSCFAWIMSTTWSQSIFTEFFQKHHILANVSFLFPNNFQVYWSSISQQYHSGAFCKREMKILLLYKNASLSRGGYEMSEKDIATHKIWCHSVFLLSIHHLTCVKCMYFSFSV